MSSGCLIDALEAHALLAALVEQVQGFTFVGEPEWGKNSTLHVLRNVALSMSRAA